MISRRDFLKKSAKATLAVSGGLTLDALFSSSPAIAFKEDAPVIYPRVGRPGQKKVQPPENGCYIGFHRDRWHPFYDKFVRDIGKKPRIMTPSPGIAENSTAWPKSAVDYVDSKGAIPFIYRDLDIHIRAHGFRNLVDNKEFRKDLTQYAKHLEERNKPIFICTLREMNDPHTHLRGWKGKSPKDTTKLWRYIWQIFEDTGANECATWVWEVITEESFSQGHMRNPEPFYPGDDYVDWIGLSAYGAPWNDNRSFRSITSRSYRKMRRNYPEKPIVMAEFGKTRGSGQAKWLKKGYKTIKSWPGIKAAICWNGTNPPIEFNYRLSDKSLKALKEIFKDPYFIGSTGKG